MRRLLLPLVLTVGALTLAAGCSAGGADETGSQDGELRQTTPEDHAAGTAIPEETTVNGFDFGGFEYWPYKEAQPIYPDKIQWGFEAGSGPARRCMAAGTRELAKILQDPPASLLQLREQHDITSFFNWNNDYTGAQRDGMARLRKLWLYESSLIKWISETNTDGSCLIPTREELDQFATQCLTTFPNCSL
jgi:hypothetical protein